MTITEISSLAQFEEIINRDEISVFDFWAGWCQPCMAMKPFYEKLPEKFTSAKFYKVDVEEAIDVATKAGVTAMPTFLVYKGGQVIDKMIGAKGEAGLQAFVAAHAA